MGILQERINELNSAVVNVVGNRVNTIGFYNTERLMSYIEAGKKNWSSTGRYPVEDLVFHDIKTNATVILQQNGVEVARYNYKQIAKGIMLYENQQNKSGKATAIYEIRKEIYSSTWNLRFADESQVFQTWDDMRIQVMSEYNYDLGKEVIDGETVNS